MPIVSKYPAETDRKFVCGLRPQVDGSVNGWPGKIGWLSQPIGPLSGRTSAAAAEVTFGSASTRVISAS